MTTEELETRAAAPYGTGGGGVVLEHRYGASLLASLLTGDPVPELGSDVKPLAVRFQASAFSPVDDLVVYGRTADGGRRKVSVGVRRAPKLVSSESASVHLLSAYLRVVISSWDEVRAGRWRLALAVASPNPAVAEVRGLAVIAAASPDEAAFRVEMARPGRTNKPVRDRLPHLDALVRKALDDGDERIEARGIAAAELTWRVLWSLQVRELRLEGADQTDRAFTVSQLRPVTRNGTVDAADGLLSRLESLADGYAPAGAEVTPTLLRRDLSGTPLARSLDHAQAWAILDGLAGRLRDRIRSRLVDSTTELSLDRADAKQQLAAAMAAAGAGPAGLVVLGEPDVGKSALTLQAAGQLRDAGVPVTMLSLRDLPATTMELESLLAGPLADVLGATATGEARLLVIDGAEAVLEGRGQLLAELAAAAFRAGLGVVAVTRSDAADAARQALERAMAAADVTGQAREHEVPRLTSAEASEIIAAFGSLARLSLESRAVWLLGRPGLVDLLLRAGGGTVLPAGPLSEADVFAVVWRQLVRRGEVTAPGGLSPDARAQALLTLARRSLLPGSPGQLPDAAALPSLRSDGLLLPAGLTSAWDPGDEFASDLIRDFAVARLLITTGWDLLSQAGAPRWALRAARLACQAALAAQADTEPARLTMQAAFDRVAAEHGRRWAEIPLEALLTLGTAGDALTRAWPTLLASDRAGLRTVLRLALQRYAAYGIGDVTILEPLVALAYCGPEDLGQDDHHDRGAGDQIRELVLTWLRGLIQAGTGSLALRQQVRDRILAAIPEPYDDFAVEALATLGPDLDDRARVFLQGLADAGGGNLSAAVESAGAVRAMAEHQPELLLALAERFYIPPSGRDDSFGFFGGIRSHEKAHGGGGRMAAWYYGPFYLLLKYRPAGALALINRMLNRAAAIRVGGWADLQAPVGTAQEPDGLDLDLPNVGARRCIGDFETWRWYRGGANAPAPCLSALLAVERFADELLDTWHLPAADVVAPLLSECRNLAMPGLVTGLLVRHPEVTGNLLDGWLARPELWFTEGARVAAEGIMHIQGPDPSGLRGRERRRCEFSDIAVSMTAQAVLDGDQQRLSALAAVADELLHRATTLAADDDDDQATLAHGWAALLHAENYRLVQVSDSPAIEFQPPDNVAQRMAAGERALARVSTAWRLQSTYAGSPDRAAPPDTLADDLAAARELADNPPDGGPVRLTEPVAAVAAAAVVAHAQGRARVADDDLRWSAGFLAEVAACSSSLGGAFGSAQSINWTGADRSAAAALPALLLPVFDETGLDRDAIQEALASCAVSSPDEVRMILARAGSCVWAAPCGPAGTSGACRHLVLWHATVQGLRDCQLGGWDQAAPRRLIDPLGEPYDQTLPNVEAERLLLNRLTAPLIAAAAAARSGSCAAGDARDILDVLLAAHRRAAILWTENGYRHPSDQHGPATARVLAELAARDTSPLTEHVRAFASGLHALTDLLRDLALAFSYDDDLRPALPGIWHAVMQTALDEFGAHPDRLSDWQWSGRALGGLIPAPQIEVAELRPDDVLEHARSGWPVPDVFADLVSRWIPIARGYPEPIGDLVQLVRCGSPAWQATTGLVWVEDLARGHYKAAARAWFLTRWLQDVRAAGHLDAGATARWRRIIDGLAAEGDSLAASLQQAEE